MSRQKIAAIEIFVYHDEAADVDAIARQLYLAAKRSLARKPSARLDSYRTPEGRLNAMRNLYRDGVMVCPQCFNMPSMAGDCSLCHGKPELLPAGIAREKYTARPKAKNRPRAKV